MVEEEIKEASNLENINESDIFDSEFYSNEEAIEWLKKNELKVGNNKSINAEQIEIRKIIETAFKNRDDERLNYNIVRYGVLSCEFVDIENDIFDYKNPYLNPALSNHYFIWKNSFFIEGLLPKLIKSYPNTKYLIGLLTTSEMTGLSDIARTLSRTEISETLNDEKFIKYFVNLMIRNPNLQNCFDENYTGKTDIHLEYLRRECNEFLINLNATYYNAETVNVLIELCSFNSLSEKDRKIFIKKWTIEKDNNKNDWQSNQLCFRAQAIRRKFAKKYIKFLSLFYNDRLGFGNEKFIQFYKENINDEEIRKTYYKYAPIEAVFEITKGSNSLENELIPLEASGYLSTPAPLTLTRDERIAREAEIINKALNKLLVQNHDDLTYEQCVEVYLLRKIIEDDDEFYFFISNNKSVHKSHFYSQTIKNYFNKFSHHIDLKEHFYGQSSTSALIVKNIDDGRSKYLQSTAESEKHISIINKLDYIENNLNLLLESYKSTNNIPRLDFIIEKIQSIYFEITDWNNDKESVIKIIDNSIIENTHNIKKQIIRLRKDNDQTSEKIIKYTVAASILLFCALFVMLQY